MCRSPISGWTTTGCASALHDFFLAKSLDALKPGGVLALVTSHYTLDKQHPGLRTHLAQQADFLGAIRLPAEAFAQEGTRVVTDILCLRKRAPGEEARHADPAWLETAPSPSRRRDPRQPLLLQHPAMVLGTWSRHDRLYAGEGYTLRATGDLAAQLAAAIQHLPQGVYTAHPARRRIRPSPTPLPPLEPHLTEGSFFVTETKALMQIQQGTAVPVTHGTTPLQADGTLLGRRLAALIALRDHARRVLQSQNEGWPEAQRQEARRALNRVYDRFVQAYGPINKTTLSTTTDGTTIRRMPNLVTFRDDPDAMLVMALEHYDERTGLAEKAAILHHDVVGRHTPRTTVQSAEEGLLVSLDQRGVVDLPYIATLYKAPVRQIIAELGDLIYQDPDTQVWHTADVYLSAMCAPSWPPPSVPAAPMPAMSRPCAWSSRRTCCPATSTPTWGALDPRDGHPGLRGAAVQRPARRHHRRAPHARGPLEPGRRDHDHAVGGATTEYGTARANGVGLLEQALNLKSPTIYDVFERDGKEERVLNQEETLAARDKQKAIKERFRAWIFADPDRTERLVRFYNETYNKSGCVALMAPTWPFRA